MTTVKGLKINQAQLLIKWSHCWILVTYFTKGFIRLQRQAQTVTV